MNSKLHGANLELDGIVEESAHLLDGLAAVISLGVRRPDCSCGGGLTTYAPLMDEDYNMSQRYGSCSTVCPLVPICDMALFKSHLGN